MLISQSSLDIAKFVPALGPLIQIASFILGRMAAGVAFRSGLAKDARDALKKAVAETDNFLKEYRLLGEPPESATLSTLWAAAAGALADWAKTMDPEGNREALALVDAMGIKGQFWLRHNALTLEQLNDPRIDFDNIVEEINTWL